jgi:anti-anti-sigma regulatory factor
VNSDGAKRVVPGAISGVLTMQIAGKGHTISDKFSFDEDTALKVFLRENIDLPVEICAQNLRKVDSLLLQYLIAASQKWRGKGLSFSLTNLSPEVGNALNLLGIHDEILSWKVAA